VVVNLGDDGSVYVFEARQGALPELELAIEANGYDSITGAQYGLSFAISPPDEHGDYFVVEAHAYPWIASSWRSVRYRVFVPTGLVDAPKLLLNMREDAYLESDKIASVKADRDAFEVSFLSWWGDHNGVPYRGHIRHYIRDGTDFVRTQPVVFQALDLPDEWLRLPWSEAQRWAKSSTSLQRWHVRLRDPQPLEKVVHQHDNRVAHQIIGELHGIPKPHNSVVVPPETNPGSDNPAAESHQTRV